MIEKALISIRFKKLRLHFLHLSLNQTGGRDVIVDGNGRLMQRGCGR